MKIVRVDATALDVPLQISLPGEMHYLAVELCRKIYRGLPEAEDGWLKLPDAPGLGFEPDRDAIAEIARSRRK